MALPAFADPQPVETSVSVGVSNYQERDVPGHLVVGGDNRRYDIDIWQFRLLTPAGRAWSIGVDLSRETMSGASPWGTVPDADGEAALIMSGATIDDTRTEVNVSATRHGEHASSTLTVSQSREDDYDAVAVAWSGKWTGNRDLTTVSAGLSYSGDTVAPTDAAQFGRVLRAERRSRSGFVGVAQVLDRWSVLHAALGLTGHAGYLSDPYKLRDVRPDRRRERTLEARYRRFLDPLDAAAHLDYRYYADDWGVESHTLHAAWHQTVNRALRLVPNLRYYSQSEADFFAALDDFGRALDEPQSADFRLSTYGALTLGLQAVVRQPGWSVTLSADRYRASERYALEAGTEHPARLAFTLVSVMLDLTF